MNHFFQRLEAFMTHFMASHFWPLMRIFVRVKLSKRCSRCVLSERAIEIFADGLCEECHKFEKDNLGFEYKKNINENAQSLQVKIDEILKESVGKGKKWDVLLLFSGGKDSTYMLHQLVRNYPEMKILALLVDTGFMSPIALENAVNVLTKFGVDYIKYDVNAAFIKKTFNMAFKRIVQQGPYSLVDLIDGEIIFDSARNFATSFNIPMIICGLAKNQVENVYGNIGVEFGEEQEINPFVRYCELKLEEIYTTSEMKYWYDRTKLKEGQIPRFILPMVAWDPSEEEIVETLLGLKLLDKNKTSPLLTNNSMIPVIAIAEVNIFGFTSFEVEFAKTIREGKAPRSYWLNLFQMMEYSGKTGHFVGKAIEKILYKLDLRKSDLGMK